MAVPKTAKKRPEASSEREALQAAIARFLVDTAPSADDQVESKSKPAMLPEITLRRDKPTEGDDGDYLTGCLRKRPGVGYQYLKGFPRDVWASLATCGRRPKAMELMEAAAAVGAPQLTGWVWSSVGYVVGDGLPLEQVPDDSRMATGGYCYLRAVPCEDRPYAREAHGRSANMRRLFEDEHISYLKMCIVTRTDKGLYHLVCLWGQPIPKEYRGHALWLTNFDRMLPLCGKTEGHVGGWCYTDEPDSRLPPRLNMRAAMHLSRAPRSISYRRDVCHRGGDSAFIPDLDLGADAVYDYEMGGLMAVLPYILLMVLCGISLFILGFPIYGLGFICFAAGSWSIIAGLTIWRISYPSPKRHGFSYLRIVPPARMDEAARRLGAFPRRSQVQEYVDELAAETTNLQPPTFEEIEMQVLSRPAIWVVDSPVIIPGIRLELLRNYVARGGTYRTFESTYSSATGSVELRPGAQEMESLNQLPGDTIVTTRVHWPATDVKEVSVPVPSDVELGATSRHMSNTWVRKESVIFTDRPPALTRFVVFATICAWCAGLAALMNILDVGRTAFIVFVALSFGSLILAGISLVQWWRWRKRIMNPSETTERDQRDFLFTRATAQPFVGMVQRFRAMPIVPRHAINMTVEHGGRTVVLDGIDAAALLRMLALRADFNFAVGLGFENPVMGFTNHDITDVPMPDISQDTEQYLQWNAIRESSTKQCRQSPIYPTTLCAGLNVCRRVLRRALFGAGRSVLVVNDVADWWLLDGCTFVLNNGTVLSEKVTAYNVARLEAEIGNGRFFPSFHGDIIDAVGTWQRSAVFFPRDELHVICSKLRSRGVTKFGVVNFANAEMWLREKLSCRLINAEMHMEFDAKNRHMQFISTRDSSLKYDISEKALLSQIAGGPIYIGLGDIGYQEIERQYVGDLVVRVFDTRVIPAYQDGDIVEVPNQNYSSYAEIAMFPPTAPLMNEEVDVDVHVVPLTFASKLFAQEERNVRGSLHKGVTPYNASEAMSNLGPDMMRLHWHPTMQPWFFECGGRTEVLAQLARQLATLSAQAGSVDMDTWWTEYGCFPRFRRWWNSELALIHLYLKGKIFQPYRENIQLPTFALACELDETSVVDDPLSTIMREKEGDAAFRKRVTASRYVGSVMLCDPRSERDNAMQRVRHLRRGNRTQKFKASQLQKRYKITDDELKGARPTDRDVQVRQVGNVVIILVPLPPKASNAATYRTIVAFEEKAADLGVLSETQLASFTKDLQHLFGTGGAETAQKIGKRIARQAETAEGRDVPVANMIVAADTLLPMEYYILTLMHGAGLNQGAHSYAPTGSLTVSAMTQQTAGATLARMVIAGPRNARTTNLESEQEHIRALVENEMKGKELIAAAKHHKTADKLVAKLESRLRVLERHTEAQRTYVALLMRINAKGLRPSAPAISAVTKHARLHVPSAPPAPSVKVEKDQEVKSEGKEREVKEHSAGDEADDGTGLPKAGAAPVRPPMPNVPTRSLSLSSSSDSDSAPERHGEPSVYDLPGASEPATQPHVADLSGMPGTLETKRPAPMPREPSTPKRRKPRGRGLRGGPKPHGKGAPPIPAKPGGSAMQALKKAARAKPKDVTLDIDPDTRIIDAQEQTLTVHPIGEHVDGSPSEIVRTTRVFSVQSRLNHDRKENWRKSLRSAHGRLKPQYWNANTNARLTRLFGVADFDINTWHLRSLTDAQIEGMEDGDLLTPFFDPPKQFENLLGRPAATFGKFPLFELEGYTHDETDALGTLYPTLNGSLIEAIYGYAPRRSLAATTLIARATRDEIIDALTRDMALIVVHRRVFMARHGRAIVNAKRCIIVRWHNGRFDRLVVDETEDVCESLRADLYQMEWSPLSVLELHARGIVRPAATPYCSLHVLMGSEFEEKKLSKTERNAEQPNVARVRALAIIKRFAIVEGKTLYVPPVTVGNHPTPVAEIASRISSVMVIAHGHAYRANAEMYRQNLHAFSDIRPLEEFVSPTNGILHERGLEEYTPQCKPGELRDLIMKTKSLCLRQTKYASDYDEIKEYVVVTVLGLIDMLAEWHSYLRLASSGLVRGVTNAAVYESKTGRNLTTFRPTDIIRGFDGAKFVDAKTVRPPTFETDAPYVIVNDDTNFNHRAKMLEVLSHVWFDIFGPHRVHQVRGDHGPAGCGKTTHGLQLMRRNPHAVMLVASREALKTLRPILGPKRVWTYEGWIYKTYKKRPARIDRIIADEGMMRPAGLLRIIMRITDAPITILSDPYQISNVQWVTGAPEKHLNIKFDESVWRWVTYRCPESAQPIFDYFYPEPVEIKSGRKGNPIEYYVITGVHELPRDADMYIGHLQSTKTRLQALGLPALSTHESQGGAWDSVVCVLDTMTKAPILMDPRYALVMLTRHRERIRVYTTQPGSDLAYMVVAGGGPDIKTLRAEIENATTTAGILEIGTVTPTATRYAVRTFAPMESERGGYLLERILRNGRYFAEFTTQMFYRTVQPIDDPPDTHNERDIPIDVVDWMLLTFHEKLQPEFLHRWQLKLPRVPKGIQVRDWLKAMAVSLEGAYENPNALRTRFQNSSYKGHIPTRLNVLYLAAMKRLVATAHLANPVPEEMHQRIVDIWFSEVIDEDRWKLARAQLGSGEVRLLVDNLRKKQPHQLNAMAGLMDVIYDNIYKLSLMPKNKNKFAMHKNKFNRVPEAVQVIAFHDPLLTAEQSGLLSVVLILSMCARKDNWMIDAGYSPNEISAFVSRGVAKSGARKFKTTSKDFTGFDGSQKFHIGQIFRLVCIKFGIMQSEAIRLVLPLARAMLVSHQTGLSVKKQGNSNNSGGPGTYIFNTVATEMTTAMEVFARRELLVQQSGNSRKTINYDPTMVRTTGDDCDVLDVEGTPTPDLTAIIQGVFGFEMKYVRPGWPFIASGALVHVLGKMMYLPSLKVEKLFADNLYPADMLPALHTSFADKYKMYLNDEVRRQATIAYREYYKDKLLSVEGIRDLIEFIASLVRSYDKFKACFEGHKSLWRVKTNPNSSVLSSWSSLRARFYRPSDDLF